ncbi:MAG: fumarylacetoacetate hydrolase family protein [Peptostreptococcaceae bacterium]|nr:fumarylacetoacetate hydrolase family protein [Peptostreptococcaceae bacterium]
MKLINYRYKKHSTPHLGVLTKDEKQVLDLAKILGEGFAKATMVDLIRSDLSVILPKIQAALDSDGPTGIAIERVDLLAPIQRPIHDIICVGENYAAHQEETAGKLIDRETLKNHDTIYFGKRASYILGNDEVLSARFDLDERLDYEVELGIVIGKTVRDLTPENVRDAIFGFTIVNDLSYRKIQMQHGQWYRGKSLDGITAVGPCIVTADEFEFPLKLELSSKVDGEPRQKGCTSQMITGVEEILIELSQGMTLEPGDIIATGTPGGVGAGYDPPRFLKKGQRITCTIEKIGSLSNPIE